MSSFLTPQPSPDRLRFDIKSNDRTAAPENFDYTGVAPTDIVYFETVGNEQKLRLVSNPLVPAHSYVTYKTTVASACTEVFGLALSQRIRFDVPYAGLIDTSNTAIPSQTSWNISSISQSTTTVSVTLTTVFTFPIGTLIHVVETIDNRINYLNCPVSWVSEDQLQIQFTFSDSASIPSSTLGPYVSGRIVLAEDIFRNYADGAAMAFYSSTATSAELIAKSNGVARNAASVASQTSDRRTSTSSTAVTVLAGGSSRFYLPSSEFRISVEQGDVVFEDKAIDSVSFYTARALISTFAPSVARLYTPIFGVVAPQYIPKPIGKITAISRTSNVVTITLDVDAAAAGLTTTQYVQVSGVRDQTNFGNSTVNTPVTSITGNSFTIAWTGTNATSYGGFISLPQGAIGQQGLTGSTIQSVTVQTADRILLSLLATPTYTTGQVVWLHGLCDSSGVSAGVDGPWIATRISTTNVWLAPLIDRNGVRKSPVVTPGATITCGGTSIQATSLELAYVELVNKSNPEVRLLGQGTNSNAYAIPVSAAGGSLVVQSVQSTPLTSTNGTMGWPVTQGSNLNTDIASAAITTTTTSGAVTISGTAGGPSGGQFTFYITAASGTTPTLDISIEGSEDGSNFTRIYDLPRMTTTGTIRTPMLYLGNYRSIRYVRTVGGTSPSFTMSGNRTHSSFYNSKPLINRVDRTIVLTTLSSTTPAFFVDGTEDLRLTIFITSATTAPAVQMQQSDDEGVSWFNIGSAITAVAGTSVSTTVTKAWARHVRAIVTTAGATVVGGWVAIRAS